MLYFRQAEKIKRRNCIAYNGQERKDYHGKRKETYLLEVWNLSTNEWGDRVKNRRVLMRLVTLADEAYDYKYHTLARIVKEMSGDNANNPDYEISSWIDDETNSMFLMSDWGSSLDKGNEWYGVEAVITPMKTITEI